MVITEEWLEKWNACELGRVWWRECGETEHEPVIRKLLAEGYLTWANWTIVRLMTHDQQIEYACFAAELVLKIFEDKYPDDKRPRTAIEAARKYLKNKTEETRAAVDAAVDAVYAAYAASAAADAVAFASYAAYAAARAAADAVASAASAASAAARAAADAVASAAARAAAFASYAATMQTIIEYGLTLIGKGKM